MPKIKIKAPDKYSLWQIVFRLMIYRSNDVNSSVLIDDWLDVITPNIQNMTKTTGNASELNPPENITPSTGTTLNGILILLPLSLLLVGLYAGVINP